MGYDNGMDRLVDHIFQALSRAGRAERAAILARARQYGHIGELVALALEDMSADIHASSEREPVHGVIPALSQDEALRLKETHRTVRRAALAAGVSKSAFERALNGSYRTYRKAA